MTKSKKNAPQELTDEELMQVTGGATRYVSESHYNSMVQACKNLKDEQGCDSNADCRWDKSECVVNDSIKIDSALEGNEVYGESS